MKRRENPMPGWKTIARVLVVCNTRQCCPDHHPSNNGFDATNPIIVINDIVTIQTVDRQLLLHVSDNKLHQYTS
jgi:hypothetical protein